MGKISPNSPLLLMLSILPMEGEIHFQSLSLFNNVTSLPGPAKELLKFLFTCRTLKKYHWSRYLQDVTEKYNLPDPARIIEMPPVDKERWKSIVKPVIVDYYDKQLQTKIHRSRIYRFIRVGDFSLKNKKLPPILTAGRTNRELLATALSVKHIIMEAPTGENLRRKRLVRTSACRYCKDDVSDTTEHMLFECRLTRENHAATRTKLDIFEHMAAATGRQVNYLISTFWKKSREMSLYVLNPCSKGNQEEIRLSEDNNKINEVIKLNQFYVLLISAIRCKDDNSKARGRKKAPGDPHQEHSRPHGPNAQSKGSYTKKRRKYNKTSSLQISLAPGDQGDDLRWTPAKDAGIKYESIVCACLGIGITTVMTAAPASHLGRKLNSRSAIWASHSFESFNRGLMFLSNWNDLLDNLEFTLCEGFGPNEAERLAEIAPIVFRNPDLKIDTSKGGCLPVLIVTLSHKILASIVHIESESALETLLMWPDVAPSKGFATMEQQVLSELQDLDLVTYNTRDRQILITRPVENFPAWCHDVMAKGDWYSLDMRHPEAGEMYWRLVQVLLELHEPGTTVKMREQSKLDRYGFEFQTLYAERMSATFNGRVTCHFHPIEVVRRITGAVEELPGDMDEISPIRSSRGSGSRLSSTPSGRRMSTSEEIRMRSDMQNLQAKINILERVVGGMDINQRTPSTPLQVTFDEGDQDQDGHLCGRHAALVKGILRKAADSDTSMMSQDQKETRKRSRANTSKFKDTLLPNLNITQGTVRDGPNGTVELSSDDEGAENLVIDLTEEGRHVTRERGANQETSPELEERPRPRELGENDARRILDMRRSLTSTRRLSPVRPEPSSPPTSPVARSRSPLRRPANARDQSQRARIDEEERQRLIDAVRDKNAGRHTEDTERLESTDIVFTSREMYEDFLAQATGQREPGPTLTAILTMVDNQNVTEITIPRTDGEEEEVHRRTPPPSYDEATGTAPTEKKPNPEASQDPNSTILGSTITLDGTSTITLDSTASDAANNNSLDSSIKSTSNSADNSVEIIGQTLYGARQGSHVPPSSYRRISQNLAAQALKSYAENLREGQFEDLPEMTTPEIPDLMARSIAQSPLERQQQLHSTSSNTGSEHSSMPSLTKTLSASELSDISDDGPGGLDLTGNADTRSDDQGPDPGEEDEIILHEDDEERAELEADLPQESVEILDEIDNTIKGYYTKPRGKVKGLLNDPRVLIDLFRERTGQGREKLKPDYSHITSEAKFNCMVKKLECGTMKQMDMSTFLYDTIFYNVSREYKLKDYISLILGCNSPRHQTNTSAQSQRNLTHLAATTSHSRSLSPSLSNTTCSDTHSDPNCHNITTPPTPKPKRRHFDTDRTKTNKPTFLPNPIPTLSNFNSYYVYYYYNYYPTLSPPRSTTQPGPEMQEIPYVNSGTQLVHSSFALMFIRVLEWK